MRSWMEEKKPFCLLEDPLRWTERLKKPRLYLWGCITALPVITVESAMNWQLPRCWLSKPNGWILRPSSLHTTACHKMWAELIKLHRDRLWCLGCGLNGASNVTGSVHMEWQVRVAAANVSAHMGSARRAHSSQELNFGERGPGRWLI